MASPAPGCCQPTSKSQPALNFSAAALKDWSRPSLGNKCLQLQGQEREWPRKTHSLGTLPLRKVPQLRFQLTYLFSAARLVAVKNIDMFHIVRHAQACGNMSRWSNTSRFWRCDRSQTLSTGQPPKDNSISTNFECYGRKPAVNWYSMSVNCLRIVC